ncbi:MAG: carboxymuconolactone decarboxylase family protein [Pseudobdellovibrionaceae bacterium]
MSFTDKIDQTLASVYKNQETNVYRDLSLNIKKSLEEGALEEKDRYLTLLACATAVGHSELAKMAREILTSLDVPAEHIQEASESAGIMGMLNTYYKFRGYVANAEPYSRAGLRMMTIGKPQLGKKVFEMLAFAVSVVNGCPTCVGSHEEVLLKEGLSHDQIHELARIASITKGLSGLKFAQSL